MNFHPWKTQILILRIGCYARAQKLLSCLLFKAVLFIKGKVKVVPVYAMKAY
jgi:hypothetical protein